MDNKSLNLVECTWTSRTELWPGWILTVGLIVYAIVNNCCGLVMYCHRSQGYNLTLRLTPKEQKALLRVVGSRGQDALSLRFYQLWRFDPDSHNWIPDPNA